MKQFHELGQRDPVPTGSLMKESQPCKRSAVRFPGNATTCSQAFAGSPHLPVNTCSSVVPLAGSYNTTGHTRQRKELLCAAGVAGIQST